MMEWQALYSERTDGPSNVQEITFLEILYDFYWNWETKAQHKTYVEGTHQNNEVTGM